MIASVKTILPDHSSHASARPAAAETGDFAAVARSVAAGDIETARSAMAATASSAGAADTLAQTLAAGNLAAARLALCQLGADPYAAPARTEAAPRDAATAPPAATPVPSAAPLGTDTKIAAAGPGSAAANVTVPAHGATMVVADVGTLADGGETGTAAAGAEAGTIVSGAGGSYRVADVMLALATGNAGSIPADVINLYGPGGARYDPAAIMDAYRGSDIGKAQMAMFAWMSRPA